jgi:hypothetical protein
MFRDLKSREVISLAVLVIGLLGIYIGAFGWSLPEHINQPNKEEVLIFFAFTILLISERLSGIIDRQQTEKSREQINRSVSKLHDDILRNEIVFFNSTSDALLYAAKKLQAAVYVKDTMLRSEDDRSEIIDEAARNEWISGVQGVLERNGVVRQIYNKYGRKNFEKTLKEIGISSKSSGFQPRELDQLTPIIGVMVLVFEEGEKEVLFGWRFSDYPSVIVLASRKELLVNYFDKYFEDLYDLAKEPSTAQ